VGNYAHIQKIGISGYRVLEITKVASSCFKLQKKTSLTFLDTRYCAQIIPAELVEKYVRRCCTVRIGCWRSMRTLWRGREPTDSDCRLTWWTTVKDRCTFSAFSRRTQEPTAALDPTNTAWLLMKPFSTLAVSSFCYSGYWRQRADERLSNPPLGNL